MKLKATKARRNVTSAALSIRLHLSVAVFSMALVMVDFGLWWYLNQSMAAYSSSAAATKPMQDRIQMSREEIVSDCFG